MHEDSGRTVPPPPQESTFEPTPETTDGQEPEASIEEESGAVRRRWIPRVRLTAFVIAVPFLIHLALAYRHLQEDLHLELPNFGDIASENWTVWISVYLDLFIHPGAVITTAQLYSLWALVYLGLAVYVALKAGEGVPGGVTVFLSYGLASLIILGVVVPAVWILFGNWGSAAVAFTPAIILALIAIFLARGAGVESEH